ncbi:unnamed protein product, partial [Prorocentrum cordatum]
QGAAEVYAVVEASDVDGSDECRLCMSLEAFGEEVGCDFHDSVDDQVGCDFHDLVDDRVGYDFHGSVGDHVDSEFRDSVGDQLESEFLGHSGDEVVVATSGGKVASAGPDVDSILMLDGGSDGRCARPGRARNNEVNEATIELIAAQKVSLDGEAAVPFAVGGQAACRATFQIGPFARNAFSTCYDAGFDASYSREDRCYVGCTRPDGQCAKDKEGAEREVRKEKRLMKIGVVATNEGAGELGAAIYGAKGQPWSRLKHAGLDRKQDLDFEGAVGGRYQQQVDGRPVVGARAIEAPCAPTEIEREQREAYGHAVFKKWCPACVFGMGLEGRRVERLIYGGDVGEWLIFFDWAFNATRDAENVCDGADRGLGAPLAAADRRARCLFGGALWSEAAGDYEAKQLARLMEKLACQRPELRCDAEPAAKALRDEVVAARGDGGLGAGVSQGRARDIKSTGFVEERVRRWRGRLIANGVQVERNCGIELAPRPPRWPFFARRASNATNLFGGGAGGYAANFAVYGGSYTGAVAPFAEAVMAGALVSATGQRRSMGGVAPRLTRAGAALAKWSPGGADHGPGGKRLRVDDSIVGAVGDISKQLDYETLLTAEELTRWGTGGFRMEEAALTVDIGLKLFDEFGIYSVHLGPPPMATARLVSRGFAWLEERDDPFAPGSTSLTSRVVDFFGFKGDDDPEGPLVMAVGDVASTRYQVPEKEEFCCDPSREWLAARAEAGPGVDVVWELVKRLPGRRAASREWAGFAADQIVDCAFERSEACPQLYRNTMARLSLELHMCDFFCAGRKSDMGGFLPMIRTKLKHGANIIAELGLKGADAVRTPEFGLEDIFEFSPPFVHEQVARCRSRVGSGLHLAQDRTGIQRAVGMSAGDSAKPTEFSWKWLLRLGRHLVGTSDQGAFAPKVGARAHEKGAIQLRTLSDSDHGGKEAKRKSAACGVIFADGVGLATLVRRQDLAVSSGESEFYALSTVATDGEMLRDLLTWLGFRVEWALATGSSAARGMSLGRGVGMVRDLGARALWVQQATRLLGLKVPKCRGSEKPSDTGTKSRAAEVHEQLCKQVGLRRLTGEFGAVCEVKVNVLIEKFR